MAHSYCALGARCLFEIFVAIKVGCRVELILPPTEEAAFGKALQDDFESIAASLSTIDVKRSQASIPADEKNIKQLVQNGLGFPTINRMVVDGLQCALDLQFERHKRSQGWETRSDCRELMGPDGRG